MKILCITTTYFPLTGGAESHCKLLCETLVSRGHAVTVLTHAHSPNTKSKEELNGVQVLRTANFVEKISLTHHIAWEEAFFGPLAESFELLKGSSFDIIHTQNQASLLLGAYLKEYFSCPLVSSFHETCPESEPFGQVRSTILLKHLPIDCVVAGSEYFKNQAFQFSVPANKIRLIHLSSPTRNLANCKDKRSQRVSLGIPANSFCILVVGRFKPRKQQLFIVEAFLEIAARIRSLHLCLAGSCNSASESYYEQIVKLIQINKHKDRVTIFKDIDDMGISSLLHTADAGVLLSTQEGFGIAILEYMGAGIPVIASDIPGITEIVNNKNGILIRPNDKQGFHDAVTKIMNDNEFRNSLISHGRETWKRFNVDSMIDATLQCYSELLSRKAL